MLSYTVADDQKTWDGMLMHALAAHNTNVSRGPGLAPNEVKFGIYPRLTITILEGRGIKAIKVKNRTNSIMWNLCEIDK